MLSTMLDELVVVDAPRRGDDDVVRAVAIAVKGAERAPGDGRDHIGRAQDRPSQRMTAEDGPGDQVEDQLLGRVVHHRDLLEDDLPFRVEVGEAGSEDHVGHDVERGLQVLVEDARVDDRVVARGRGVQLAAERVEDLGDLEGRVGGGALEEQMLEEVAHSCVRVALVPRARADPEPDGRRADAGSGSVTTRVPPSSVVSR